MRTLKSSVVVFLLGILIQSCSDRGADTSYQLATPGELGKVSLAFDNPPAGITEVVASISRTGFPSRVLQLTILDSTQSASGNFSDVVPGLWHLRVEAKDSSHVVRYSGETDVQVVAGQITNVALQLLPGTGGGIHITVTWGTLTKLTKNWLWTRDNRGGGSQQSLQLEGDSVVILPAQFVHFVNKDAILGNGTYRIKFKGNQFLFAWRISPQDSTAGKALILDNALGGTWSLIHVAWEGFFYGWYNAPNQFRNQIAFPFATNVWHEIIIRDTGHNLSITFDGQSLNFFTPGSIPVEAFFADVSAGYQGIGNYTTIAKYFDLEHSSQ